MVSLATGSLFADAALELSPESYQRSGPQAGLSVLAGIYIFFLLERLLHWRHKHSLEGTAFGYLNLAADAIHNFTDGAIIGASYLVSIPIGVSTTAAIIAHEIPHEPGNFFVLLYAGFSRTRALFYNFLSAIFAIAGPYWLLWWDRERAAFLISCCRSQPEGSCTSPVPICFRNCKRKQLGRNPCFSSLQCAFGAAIIWFLNQVTS